MTIKEFFHVLKSDRKAVPVEFFQAFMRIGPGMLEKDGIMLDPAQTQYLFRNMLGICRRVAFTKPDLSIIEGNSPDDLVRYLLINIYSQEKRINPDWARFFPLSSSSPENAEGFDDLLTEMIDQREKQLKNLFMIAFPVNKPSRSTEGYENLWNQFVGKLNYVAEKYPLRNSRAFKDNIEEHKRDIFHICLTVIVGKIRLNYVYFITNLQRMMFQCFMNKWRWIIKESYGIDIFKKTKKEVIEVDGCKYEISEGSGARVVMGLSELTYEPLAGSEDPTALKSDDIKRICNSLLSHGRMNPVLHKILVSRLIDAMEFEVIREAVNREFSTNYSIGVIRAYYCQALSVLRDYLRRNFK